jgi:CHAT domain-containing protein
MKIKNPKDQTIDQIVSTLLTNTKKQYTESSHAEIYNRLIKTISLFNEKAERTERFVLLLATAQVVLAVAQIILALS